MNDDPEADPDPNLERVMSVCETVLLRLLDENQENPDVDRCLLPGVDD